MEEEIKPHMVKQVITFSDGTETVINYRGRVVDGEVILDKVEEVKFEEPKVEVEETVEEPKEETVSE